MIFRGFNHVQPLYLGKMKPMSTYIFSDILKPPTSDCWFDGNMQKKRETDGCTTKNPVER